MNLQSEVIILLSRQEQIVFSCNITQKLTELNETYLRGSVRNKEESLEL